MNSLYQVLHLLQCDWRREISLQKVMKPKNQLEVTRQTLSSRLGSGHETYAWGVTACFRKWQYFFLLCSVLRVVELTGDTTPDIRAIEQADIIVTTPEKWDGISRSWQNRYDRESGWNKPRHTPQVKVESLCVTFET